MAAAPRLADRPCQGRHARPTGTARPGRSLALSSWPAGRTHPARLSMATRRSVSLARDSAPAGSGWDSGAADLGSAAAGLGWAAADSGWDLAGGSGWETDWATARGAPSRLRSRSPFPTRPASLPDGPVG